MKGEVGSGEENRGRNRGKREKPEKRSGADRGRRRDHIAGDERSSGRWSRRRRKLPLLAGVAAGGREKGKKRGKLV